MVLLNYLFELITHLHLFLLTAVASGGLLLGMHKLLIEGHPDLENECMFPRQLAMLGVTIAAVAAMAPPLPMNENSRNQVVGFIGLVLSGIFAFSSSSIFANLMGGISLRITKPLRIGDCIHVQDYFGRITGRRFLDTEIQSENRKLIAVPNTYLRREHVFNKGVLNN